jgi:hypothetical protein
MPRIKLNKLVSTEKGTPLFIRRSVGERAYAFLKAELLKVPEGYPLVVEFTRYNLMDVSFADASLGRLGQEIVEGRMGERCLVLDGLMPDSLTNLEAMIASRPTKLAFLVTDMTTWYEVVGDVPDYLKKTLSLMAERGHMTAEELAKEKRLELSAAGNHLKRLYDLRLLRREGEAKRGGARKGAIHTYYFWQWYS